MGTLLGSKRSGGSEMGRRPFIAGNWKLNLGPAEASALASALRGTLPDTTASVAVFPTAMAVPAVVEALTGTGVGVGVQDIAAYASGAYTGANSAVIARAVGCEYCLVGHSERRQYWGETDEACAAKVKLALESGLLPILCVGETLDQRRSGTAADVVRTQLAGGLASLAPDQVGSVTLAYEPVWAIGTGETATPAQAQEMHASIRAWLRQHHASVADDIRIQYGGSVKPGNATELLAGADVDGALVGGASLKADSFAAIVAAVS